jgi:hypothetical protein
MFIGAPFTRAKRVPKTATIYVLRETFALQHMYLVYTK